MMENTLDKSVESFGELARNSLELSTNRDPNKDEATDIRDEFQSIMEARNSLGIVGDRPKRTVSLTEKGKSYTRDIQFGKRKLLYRDLQKQMELITASQNSSERIEVIRCELSELDEIFCNLMAVQENYIGLVDNCDQHDIETRWFETVDKEVADFKTNIHNYLVQAKNLDDNKSVESLTSKGSKKSRKSSSSSVASSSSKTSRWSQKSDSLARERAAEEKARLAELVAESEFLEERRAAEIASEKVRIKQEIAKAADRLKVFEEYDEESVCSKKFVTEEVPGQNSSSLQKGKNPHSSVEDWITENRDSINRPDLLQRERIEAPGIHVGNLVQQQHAVSFGIRRFEQGPQPCAPKIHKEEIPQQRRAPLPPQPNMGVKFRKELEDTVGTDESTLHAATLSGLFNQQSAPNVDIDVFSGDPMEYQYFMATFREVVEKKIADPMGRLIRLIKYTSGEAKELIRHCIHLPPSVCYQEAKALLSKEYGDSYIISATYMKELRKWPQIKYADALAFRTFYRFLIKCQSIMKPGPHLQVLNTPEILQILQSKLPGSLQERWNRKAFGFKRDELRAAVFSDFVDLIEEEMRLVNDPLHSREALSEVQNPFRDRIRREIPKDAKMSAYSTEMSSIKVETLHESKSCCPSCEGQHDLDRCPDYLKLDVKERSNFLYEKRLCYACYKPTSPNHVSKSCRQRRTCNICSGSHPTGLHGFTLKKRSGNDETQQGELGCNLTSLDAQVISLSVIPVRLCVKDGNQELIVYAMLDNCSQGTFIHEDIVDALKVKGVKTTVTVKTMTGEDTEESISLDNLTVSGLGPAEIKTITLPKTYSRKGLPIQREWIPTPDKLRHWSYLAEIMKDLHKEDSEIPIGLLIGANCPLALEPHEVISSQDGGPYAFRSCLGWCISGPIIKGAENGKAVRCNHIAVTDAGSTKIADHHFVLEDSVKDVTINETLKKMYHTDFSESKLEDDKSDLSQEDKKFLKMMKEQSIKSNGHYVLPLPFRNPNVYMPNNREQALKRAGWKKEDYRKIPNFMMITSSL